MAFSDCTIGGRNRIRIISGYHVHDIVKTGNGTSYGNLSLNRAYLLSLESGLELLIE